MRLAWWLWVALAFTPVLFAWALYATLSGDAQTVTAIGTLALVATLPVNHPGIPGGSIP
jgi:hypothetical protein